MAKSPMAILALGLAAIVLSGAGLVAAQNCGCQANYCCSSAGYCGTNASYCGPGCQSGPCTASGGGSGDPVESVVTEAFFDGIKSQAGDGCAGKSFYTRQSFLDGAQANPDFGKGSTSDDGKREIAAFFAHVTHETGYMCYVEEKDWPSKFNDYCNTDEMYKQWPCSPGKGYYGRGPLQLSWNYNYGAAGQKLGFDGLNNPEKVAQDPALTFQAAFWFWMTSVHQVVPDGFGATTKAINSGECNGGNTATVNARARYYAEYCKQFGVDPGNNLTC